MFSKCEIGGSFKSRFEDMQGYQLSYSHQTIMFYMVPMRKPFLGQLKPCSLYNPSL
jgi:hypothetical protein